MFFLIIISLIFHILVEMNIIANSNPTNTP
jgi:hypothetical protein